MRGHVASAKSRGGFDYLSLASFALTVLVTLVSSIGSATDGDWSAFSVLAVFLLFLLGFALYWLTRPQPIAPPSTKVFRPFRKLKSTTAWQRPEDVARICEALVRKSTTIPVIVGDSGVGKTTLLRVLVDDALADPQYRVLGTRPRYKVRVASTGLRHDLEFLLDRPSDRKPLIIVFDQLEQWLAHLRTVPRATRRKEQNWLRKVLIKAQASESYAIALSLKAEWYYDLRFLGDILPAPQHCCHIEGARLSTDAARSDRMKQYPRRVSTCARRCIHIGGAARPPGCHRQDRTRVAPTGADCRCSC